VIKSRRLRHARHVAHMEEMRNCMKNFDKKLEETT
jgi:hypothetical protein